MMRRFGRRVATIVAVACLVLPLGAHARGRHPAQPSTGLKTVSFGVRPPDFSFDVGAGPTLLSTQYGRPVVINFWATWCEPCRDEMSAFENLERAYKDRATLVTLSAEPGAAARTYLKQHGIVLPLAEDPQRRIFDAYSIGPIPVTIVLDPNGTVSHVAVGELDWKELKGAVDASLALESPPQAASGSAAER